MEIYFISYRKTIKFFYNGNTIEIMKKKEKLKKFLEEAFKRNATFKSLV